MTQIGEVALSLFQEKHAEYLKEFQLPPEQAKFTALPEQVWKEAEGRFRVVILAEETPVGFFLLHSTDRVKEYTDNPHAMLLTALSIDHRQQGKGYAKKAMQIMKEWVSLEFVSCNEIVLAVNYKNIPAQTLYRQTGYHDTGRRKIGEIGEQFIFALPIR
ncbi:GNAT family N-acetyltransferase [Rossellomorea marisflavi]|uniref:GNAT family N-acetyltransferase n=1 Tax=Rossellomorea marisflavi TaxID=189381 RepID=UPI003D2F3235